MKLNKKLMLINTFFTEEQQKEIIKYYPRTTMEKMISSVIHSRGPEDAKIWRCKLDMVAYKPRTKKKLWGVKKFLEHLSLASWTQGETIAILKELYLMYPTLSRQE